MPIDPHAKLAKIEADRIKAAESRGKRAKKVRRRRKRGPLASGEKVIIGELVDSLSTNEIVSTQTVEQIATLMRRTPDAIRDAIVSAREKLQSRASEYVDMHHAAVAGALLTQDFDVARKGAMEMIKEISAKDSTGKVERILDRESQASDQPTINIGIALGGLPQSHRD